MIELKNIRKVYKANSRKEAIALDDVNLKFSNRGLVFVLGPSGSGKTTLLNLLGGLDTPSSGDILIDGEVLNKKEGALDDYRSNYVGFIFQDYNLIDTMSVKDNLSLVCFSDNKENNNKRINEVLSLVGLNGYLDRYPFELSGGERKRVSIARALLKDSSFILADEPTGSINYEMAIEVMECLKKISLNRLVIVVTHNEELAKNYGDRIIRLSSGKVVSDEKEIENEEIDSLKEKRTSDLSFNMKLKLSLDSLFTNKIDFILSFLVLFLCFISLSIMLFVVDYSRVDLDVKNLKSSKDIDFFSLKEYDIYHDNNINYSLFSLITEKYPDLNYIKNGVIKSSNDIKNFGLEFIGDYQELDEDSVYTFVYYIDNAISGGYLFYDANQTKKVEYEQNKEIEYEKLIGTYLLLKNDSLVKISGIIKDIANFNLLTTSKNDAKNNYKRIFMESLSFFYLENSKYETFYRGTGFSVISSIISDKMSININDIPIAQKFDFLYSYDGFDPLSTNKERMLLITDNKIKRLKSDKTDNLANLNDDEIYISLNLYNKIFGELNSFNDYIEGNTFNEYKIINYPQHINEKVSFKIKRFEKDEYPMTKDFIIKGIIVNKDDAYYSSIVSLSRNNYNNFYDAINNIKIYIKKDKNLNTKEFVKDLNEYSVVPKQIATSELDYVESGLLETRKFSLPFFIILSITSCLIIYNFINRTIKKDEIKIGILKGLGIKNKNIISTYYLLTIIISILMIILAVSTTFLTLKIVNFISTKDTYKYLYLIYYKWWYTFVIISVVMFMNLFTATFIILKLRKTKVVKMIKNREC